MRASANCPDAPGVRSALALLLGLVLNACAPAERNFGIRLDELRAERTQGGIAVRVSQQVRLSDEARSALQHGVPLRLRIDLSIKSAGNWAAAESESFAYEIRYLPLSEHYQLSGPDADVQARTYPRLRHVLAALGDIDLTVSGADPAPGAVEVRLRSRIDRSGLPGPMQLPALLSPQWAHDSGWVTRQVEIGG